VTQSGAYNVFITLEGDITKIIGAQPPNMRDDSRAATSTALYTKFCEIGTIDVAYTDAHSLLQTTTNGYVFLQLLLQQIHPLLNIDILPSTTFPSILLLRTSLNLQRQFTPTSQTTPLKTEFIQIWKQHKCFSHIWMSCIIMQLPNSAKQHSSSLLR